MKQTKHIQNQMELAQFVINLSKWDFLERPMTFTYEPYKEDKTRDQENLYHRLIRDVYEQVKTFAGRDRSFEDWKLILISAFRQDQGQEAEIIEGMRGEVVPLGLSTRKLKRGEASEFIDWLYAQFNGADQLEVKWTV